MATAISNKDMFGSDSESGEDTTAVAVSGSASLGSSLLTNPTAQTHTGTNGSAVQQEAAATGGAITGMSTAPVPKLS
jgi:hypothetical protein